MCVVCVCSQHLRPPTPNPAPSILSAGCIAPPNWSPCLSLAPPTAIQSDPQNPACLPLARRNPKSCYDPRRCFAACPWLIPSVRLADLTENLHNSRMLQPQDLCTCSSGPTVLPRPSTPAISLFPSHLLSQIAPASETLPNRTYVRVSFPPLPTPLLVCFCFLAHITVLCCWLHLSPSAEASVVPGPSGPLPLRTTSVTALSGPLPQLPPPAGWPPLICHSPIHDTCPFFAKAPRLPLHAC